MSKGKAKMPFAREATGLVREIGWFTALALVMSAVIGAGINVFSVQAYGRAAAGVNNVNVLWIVLLVAIPFGASAICLGIMSSAMPRSGGPYIIMSRTVGPATGFLASWGSWVSLALSVGLLANYDIYFWGQTLQMTGTLYSNTSLANLGLWLQGVDPNGVLSWPIESGWPSIFATLILTLIMVLLAAFGANIWGRVVQILFIIPVVGTLITIGVLWGHTASQFPTYWDAVFGSVPGGSYSAISSAALPYTPSFVGSFAALPAVIFAYTAFYASSYVGGEVKNPKRNMVVSEIVGIGLIITIFVLYISGLTHAVGEEFLYAYNMVGTSAIGSPAILPMFAAVFAYAIPWLAIFICITGALWLMNDLPPFFLMATRSTFAWSFDRQFPEKFAEVSERWHSPIWAVVLCAIIAIPGVFLSAWTPWGSLFYITFIDCFTYLFICVAGLLFVKKFKSAYDKGARADLEASLGDFLSTGFLLALLAFAAGIVIAFGGGLSSLAGAMVMAVGGIAAVMLVAYAWTKRDELDKRVRVSALQIFGWIGTLFWIFILVAAMYYIFTIDPTVAGWYNMTDAPFWEIFATLLTFGVGALIYFGYRWRNKRRGIAASDIYGQIPPE
nr:APC family permease [Candidatus Njordarchaeota archaeon]